MSAPYFPLVFLAPDISGAIFAGRQPVNANLDRILHLGAAATRVGDAAQSLGIWPLERPDNSLITASTALVRGKLQT